MDTAAAAAAAVVVDLNTESGKKTTTKLLSKPTKPATTSYPACCSKQNCATATTATTADCGSSIAIESETAAGECLGSTVEAMSATPPPTPLEQRKAHNEVTDPTVSVNVSGDGHGPLNGLICRIAAGGVDKDATTTTSICLAAAADSADYFGLYAAQTCTYGVFEQQQQPLQQQQQQPQPQELATPLTPTTSTSSTNASTTPTSALLTTTTTTMSTGDTPSTAPATPISQNGSSVGPSLSPSPSMSPTPEELLQWQDMPKYLQFNPYVLRGYRPLQTFKGCLLSLFYWHNETINILTHAIPIVYILAIVPGLMPWDRGYRFLSFCHVFGSVAPWCGSFLYHLFMNIEKGEHVYYTLLKLDMVGIWVSQSFGALPLVTATTYCFTPQLKWFIIVSYCVLSLWGLYKALTASSPWQRRLCFAMPFSMRSVLTFMRIRGLVGGSHMALSHVYLQDGVSILGGAIGAMRIPEKWFPGLVDYYLNSHNIMHVLVVVAVYSMHQATIKDFEWMSTQTCNTYGNATAPLIHDEL